MMDWPNDLRCALSAQLAPDERIEWAGRPDPLQGAAADWPALLFGSFWFAASAAGFAKGLQSGDMGLAAVGLVFTAIGAFIVTRPFAEWQEQRRTAFAITDRRLLVIRKGGRAVISIGRRGIHQVERVQKARGVTLRIPTSVVGDGEGGQKIHHIVMHGLPDGDGAYRLLTRRYDAQP